MRTVGRYCQMMIFIQNPVLPFVHRLLRREGPYIITPSSLFGTWSHQILERWFVFLWRQCLGCLTHLYLWVETLPYFLLANYCDNGLHECCIAHFYHVMNFFSLFMFTRLPNEINHLSACKSVLNISFFFLRIFLLFAWMWIMLMPFCHCFAGPATLGEPCYWWIACNCNWFQ